MSPHRIFLSFGVLVLAVTTIPAAEPIPDWRRVEVVAVEGFGDLAVRLDGGEVRRAFLVGLRPIPPEVGFRPLGKEHVEDQRTRIANKVMKHLASADLFARVVIEQGGKLGLSIDAFSHKRHGFPHVWDPRKYPYCNTGWGAYNFNLYFLEQGYTTFLDNIGDNEVADVFHEVRRTIENNLSKSIVTVPAVEPRQNVQIIFYDDDFLWVARNYGDHRRPAGNTEPGVFVHSKAHGRWIEIHKISTRDGKFGTSKSDDPEAQKTLVKIPVAWDFTAYRDKPRIELPLKTSGSIAFPDRIVYEAKSQRYKLRFFSKLKIESAETTLYIPRADLLAAFGKDPSARIDDAVVPADPPKTSSLERIRMNAMARRAAIKSLAFSFTVRQEDGWRCEGQFFGEEDRFRVNRRDVVGMRFGDSRLIGAGDCRRARKGDRNGECERVDG